MRLLVAALVLVMASPASAQIGGGIDNPPAVSQISTGATVGVGTAASAGADLVTNGTFTGAATGWTLGGGGGAPDWAYASNNVTHASGGGTAALEPSTPLTVAAASVYEIKYTVSNWTSGSILASIGGVNGATVAFNTTFSEIITATGTGNLKLTPSNTFAGTIDGVQVFLLTASSAALTLTQTNDSTEFRTGNAGSFGAFVGRNAGRFVRSSTGNFGFGSALVSLGVGNSNTGVGSNALANLSVGESNVSMGTNSTLGLRTGTFNTVVGSNALRLLIAGSNNVAVGYQAGRTTLTNGSNNVFLGADTNPLTDGVSHCTALGYGASCTASNQLVVGGDTAGEGFTEGYYGHGVSMVSPAAYRHNATGGSGSDNAGAAYTIAGGASTGSAVPGSIILQTGAAGASSSTPQTPVTRITVTATPDLERTITAGGTVGAQTIDKMGGTVNFAAAAASLVVTNSLVGTSSIVFAVLRTNDTTCRLASVVPAAGSFTIFMTAACGAETSVGFWVTN